ncbi:YkuS family protein [Clostridium frigidicarnis]|uniref:Uncharacterized protein family (UPF0180) n=1 Tax=Clostridium frigidicarnis TaxID=84698 RepID=A0A1I1A2A2_9CLOT|nr:YkuS family protein [Clostridium frigidicarnis]SFB32119.1 Uncharacterised protein family (UPF0180) [Clostridium frigidicarnis]
MKIYLTPKLNYLKDDLETLGHTVVNSNIRNIEAVICDLKNQKNREEDILNNIYNRNNDILVIDSGSKSINDIENILEKQHLQGTFL